MKRRTFDLEAPLDAQLVALAERRGVSVSRVLVAAVTDYLKRQGRRR